jgi:UDP-GlcNAc:undecaprenyl-phosphate/decaprenyl-phosphate GlcNAc-1-phosphate transferase
MRLTWITALGVVLLAALASAQEPSALKNEKEKLSYALGMDLGNQLKKMSVDIDPALFGKGLGDALSGGKALLTEEEARATVVALQTELRQKQIEATRAAAPNNKKAGEAFLAENKKKEGVITLPSGLQYKILRAGQGKRPTDVDTVECQYRGSLIDGTEFDSSYRRTQPATLKLSGVIPGWREALKIMPVGSKWQLFIPPQLAYGERGAGSEIGPNATLIFEVELLAIK